MIKKLNIFFKLTLLLLTGLLFSNCQSDDLQSNNENSKVTKAKNWLENSNVKIDLLQYAKTIDWNNAVLITQDGKNAIEVPLVLVENTPINVVDDAAYSNYIKLLLIEDENQTYQVFDIIYTTKNAAFEKTDKEFNLYQLNKNYSGYITIQNNENKILYSGEYKNGEQFALHNYIAERNLSSRQVCGSYVTVGNYTTCSYWVWLPDYQPGDLPPGYMPGISGPLYQWASNTLLNAPQEGKKIANRQDYLKGFNLTLGGTLHIYVDQPVANGTATYSGVVNPDVGHTFVAIEQNGVIRVVGYYPSSAVNPFSAASTSPAYVNDSGHNYDVRLSQSLTSTQLSDVISKITTYSTQYNLNSNNCSDFAQQVAAAGGLTLPNTNGTWPGGGGTNPGNLGQDIRNMPLPPGASIKTTSGIALSNAN